MMKKAGPFTASPSSRENKQGSNFIFLLIFLLLLLFSFSVNRPLNWPHFSWNWRRFIPSFNLPRPSPIPSTPRPTSSPREVWRVVDEESAVIDLVQKVSPSVVSVVEREVVFDLFRGPRLQEASIGTGFAVEKNLIITNRHVVANEKADYTVVDRDNNRYAVKKIYRDPLNDLALLELEKGDFQPLELGDSDQVKVGQTVVAIGNALGRFTNTVTKGVISGIGRGITAGSGLGQYQRLEDVLQTDAALNPGNSGGPLLNLAQQVIGVNVAMGQGSENLGFAIPSNRVRELLLSFRKNKRIIRPFLGISYMMLDEEAARRNDLVAGAYVVKVLSDTAADKGGIEEGDIITKFNGEKVTPRTQLSKLILQYQPGDKVTLEIWRKGKTINKEVTLQEAPPK